MTPTRKLRPLTAHQYRVLCILAINPRWTVKDVARALRISSPAATKCLKRLEEKGGITRSINDYDRRLVDIYLTSKGKASIEPAQVRNKTYSRML